MINRSAKGRRLSYVVLAVATGSGCQRDGPALFGIQLSRPTSFDEARSGAHVVGHEPGTCDLCDLYYRVRTQVVRLRTAGRQGAGVVVSSSGRIVTNAHVVGDDDAPLVETYTGTMSRAKTLRSSAELDLALVQAATSPVGWTPIQVAPGGLPAVGSSVYVIGHPAGLGWTISRGIVSATRKIGEVGPTRMIQTDAAISPGNSGGPLLDREGRLLGVMVAKLSGKLVENIAFAIPAGEVAQFLAASPREDGKPEGDPPVSSSAAKP